MKLPKLTGIRNSRTAYITWNATYGKLYSALSEEVRTWVMHPTPELAEAVGDAQGHERKLLLTADAVHFRWKVAVSRMSKSGLSPATLRKMSSCRIAGVNVATPAYITCGLTRLCPHCYHRWLSGMVEWLFPALDEESCLRTLVLVKGPETAEVATRSDVESLNRVADRVRRNLTSPYRIVRRIQKTTDGLWAVTATFVTTTGPTVSLYAPEGTEWESVPATEVGLNQMIAKSFTYPCSLLADGCSAEELNAVLSLSRYIRSNQTEGRAALLNMKNQRVPPPEEIPALRAFITEEPCPHSLSQVIPI